MVHPSKGSIVDLLSLFLLKAYPQSRVTGMDCQASSPHLRRGLTWFLQSDALLASCPFEFLFASRTLVLFHSGKQSDKGWVVDDWMTQQNSNPTRT